MAGLIHSLINSVIPLKRPAPADGPALAPSLGNSRLRLERASADVCISLRVSRRQGQQDQSSSADPRIGAAARAALRRAPVGDAEHSLSGARVARFKNEDVLLEARPGQSSVDRAAQELMLKGIEASRKRHGGHVVAWLLFCDRQGVPFDKRCPADPDALMRWTESFAGRVRRPTIGAYVSAVKYWHLLHGIQWIVDDKALWYMRKGAEAMQPAGKEERPPVLVDDLLALRDNLTHSEPYDAAVYACALAAFFGMVRLGYFAFQSASGANSFRSDRHASGWDVKFVAALRNTPGFMLISCPWDKVEKSKGVTLCVPEQTYEPDLCPVEAMRHHLAVNGRATGRGLFAYRATRPGESGHRELVKTSFLKRVNECLAASGRAPISGHSFRIGGATTYLLAGKPPDVVKSAGHWKSEAFLRYWRKLDTLIARSLADIDISTV